MEVQGHCDEKFAAVREAFEENFTDNGDVGASFAATIEGEYVIDLWGGHSDKAKTTPWQKDTIVNVYSTTKTMAALCTLMLADRGELDFNAKVTTYWPEFGANGKENILVRNFLSHSAGVPGFVPKIPAETLHDWDAVCANLAAQAPWWEPGTQSGYHAITQGYLIGEVVKRITGKTLGTFFREEVAEPLGAEFHIGVPDSEFPKVAEMIGAPPQGEDSPMPMGKDSMFARVFGSIEGEIKHNSTAWRKAEIPAANGHGNARGVVRAQTAMANDGKAFGHQLLSAAGCRKVYEVQTDGPDLALMLPIKFGMGYAFPTDMMRVSPNDTAFFWGGAGGSTIVVDPDERLCFSYVMNQMKNDLLGGVRAASLGANVYAALEESA